MRFPFASYAIVKRLSILISPIILSLFVLPRNSAVKSPNPMESLSFGKSSIIFSKYLFVNPNKSVTLPTDFWIFLYSSETADIISMSVFLSRKKPFEHRLI